MHLAARNKSLVFAPAQRGSNRTPIVVAVQLIEPRGR
jgi:hypothetical protein